MVEWMRRFAGNELGYDRILDETTILNFRHLLTETLFAEVDAHLADKGNTLRSGTRIDATIIDTPSSMKNKAGALDPEMSSTKKGNDGYFGLKAHLGVDSRNGLVHSLETTIARVQDSQVWDELLHGEKTSIWAEVPVERHWSERPWRRLCERRTCGGVRRSGKVLGVMRRAPVGGEWHPLDDRINRLIAKVRAKVARDKETP